MLAKVRTEMTKLNYEFQKPPILIGGGAMEYYGMRPTGHDFDFIITREDAIILKQSYRLNHFGGTVSPDGFSKDMDSTFTQIGGFEIDLAVTMFQYGYEYFVKNAVPLEEYLVVSREDLLLMKCLAAANPTGWEDLPTGISKQRADMDLIIESIHKAKYGTFEGSVSFVAVPLGTFKGSESLGGGSEAAAANAMASVKQFVANPPNILVTEYVVSKYKCK